MSRALLCFLLYFKLVFANLENVHKRHEYNLTFKSPMIILPKTNEIPFFEIGGHVIAGKERVRLTTSLPDQQGWIWSKSTASFEGFQIDFVFRISGSSRVGADGMALWITKNKSMGGGALGSSIIWNGLGIFFDTYDNDGHGNNPIVLAMYNDGTKLFDPQTDGREMSLAHCIRDYRNRPHPVHVRIIYFNESLQLLMSSGLENSNPEFEECFTAHLVLPRGDYYFGLSAATGTLADDHDVEKFEVHSLTSLDNIKADEEAKRVEQQKEYEKEFQSKLDNLTKVEEKPKEQQKLQMEDNDFNKNLVVVWQEIVRQNKNLKNIMKSIEELRKSLPEKPATKDESQLASHIDSMRKEFVGIKHSVDLMSNKVENTNTNQQQTLLHLQTSIDNLKAEMLSEFEKVIALQRQMYQTQSKIQDALNNANKDSVNQSCISPLVLITICSIQVMCVIGFMIYQKNKENSIKKFY